LVDPQTEESMFKKLFAIGMVAVFAFSVPVVPAFASDLMLGQESAPFHALSGLPDARRNQLAAMTDDQLAAVEGAAFYCVVCINAARIKQSNTSIFSYNTYQSNAALVFQKN
jgi:hypothetical protein